MRASISICASCLDSIASCVLTCLLFFAYLFPLSCPGTTLFAQTEDAHLLRGKVIFSDGTPVSGAKVEATAICDGVSPGRDTTTSEDGSFSFPLFHREELDSIHGNSSCKQYRFRASKEDAFWLHSDENVFAGAAPAIHTVDIPVGFPLEPVQIVLDIRGGKVSFRVWDSATNRFVFAHLDLDHKPVEGKRFGSMLLATGEDGSADSRLLPSGEYTVEVKSYPCRAGQYWTARGPITSFTVESATRIEETIKIDVRNIKPLSGPNGHRLGNCKP
jgi:hypothetical protein